MAHISTRQASQMCQRLGTSLHAGVDVLATLRRESGVGSPPTGGTWLRWPNVSAGGATLAEAMRECAPYFPQLTCELIDVGEQTGNLESVLLRLSDHYQHLLRLRRTFLFGIFWPAVELTCGHFRDRAVDSDAWAYWARPPRSSGCRVRAAWRSMRAVILGSIVADWRCWYAACCAVGSGHFPGTC